MNSHMDEQQPVAWRKLLKFEDGSEAWKYLEFPLLKDGEPLYALPVADKDAERLDLLEKEGYGYALISDDNGHWACVCDGMQNVPVGEDAEDVATSFFIEKSDWKNSIREAIDAAMAKGE